MAEINVDGIEIEERLRLIENHKDWPDFLAKVERVSAAGNDVSAIAKRLYTVMQALYPELAEDVFTPDANAATGEFTFGD